MGGNAEVPLKGTSMVQRKPAGARIVDNNPTHFPLLTCMVDTKGGDIEFSALSVYTTTR